MGSPVTLADPGFVPGPPSVNLLPPDILELLRLRAIRFRLLAAAAALVVCLGALYAVQAAQLGSAQEQLAAEQSRGAAVAAEQAELAPVKSFYAEVTQTQQQIMVTMAREVLFSDVATRLTAAATDTVTLSTVSMTAVTTDLADPAVVACPGSDPFSLVAVVGCITVAGTAVSRDSVGLFVVNVLADDRFLSPFVSTTVLDEETGTVAFTGTISLTAAVYSGRYSDVEFLAAVPA